MGVKLSSLSNLQRIFIAIYLVFIGFIYGDTPIDVDFNCTVPSGIYEYQPGDTVELDVTVKNVGRPFKYMDGYGHRTVIIYQVVDGKWIELIEPDENEAVLDDPPWECLCLKDCSYNEIYSYVVPEDAVKGDYIVRISFAGIKEDFEGLITVK